jgi:hypothetical protein
MDMGSIPPQLPRDLLDMIVTATPKAAVDAIRRRYDVTMPVAMKVVSNVIRGAPANDLETHDEAWLINWIGSLGPDFESRRFRGLPPQLTGGLDLGTRELPPILLVLVISADEAMLYRYDSYGRPVGNSLHESRQAALDQAESEYGSALTEWMQLSSVPADSPQAYARQLILARGTV